LAWLLSPEDERNLDSWEGVPQGLCWKTEISIHQEELRSALTYRARDEKPGRPRPGYLAGILGAARELHLPAPYIEELELWAKTGA
jgi:hypothetical protein